MRAKLFLCTVLVVLPLAAGGCKVLSIEEDRARRERMLGAVDPGEFVDSKWTTSVIPALERKAVSIFELVSAKAADLDVLGKGHGRIPGEGSAWTFAVKGEGIVTSVDRSSKRGSASVEIPFGLKSKTVSIQLGPVVVGSAIRDALDFISFNDFADQIAFAEVGKALTSRAMRSSAAVLDNLKPGDKVRFLGVVPVRAPDQPMLITPVRIERVP